MEVIDLQSNDDITEDKFKEGNVIDYYECLPRDQLV